jgi:hypothetical protein
LIEYQANEGWDLSPYANPTNHPTRHSNLSRNHRIWTLSKANRIPVYRDRFAAIAIAERRDTPTPASLPNRLVSYTVFTRYLNIRART